MRARKKNKKKKSSRRTGRCRRVILKLIGILGIFSVLFIVAIIIYNGLGPGEVTINTPSGFYNDTIEVELGKTGLFMFQPTEIKYNLNGDDITNTGIVYDGKIRLEVPEVGYKLYTITAAVCKRNNKCSKPEVGTYVLGRNLEDDVKLEIININSSWENLYDYHKGIFVGGVTYDLNSKDKSSEGIVQGNYSNRGENWEREAYVVAFNKNGEILEDGEAYIEVSGSSSATYDVRSLKVTTLFDNNGIIYTDEFRLRSGGQDMFSGNIRSSVVSRLAEESGFEGEPGTERVVVFLNGEFYGIFDKQLNYSKQNIALMHNLTKKKYVVKHKGWEEMVFEGFEIDEDIWRDLNRSKNRERLETIFDMDNYLKYHAIQILVNNNDWPANNFAAWKYGGQKSDNKYEDGRIRFLIYDTDLIYYSDENISWFEGVHEDIFESLMDGKYSGQNASFKLVMESEYYRNKFIDLLEELMDGPFKTENVLKIIDEEAEKIKHQVRLFYGEEEYQEWKKWVGLMREAAAERNDEIKEVVWEYFGVRLK